MGRRKLKAARPLASSKDLPGLHCEFACPSKEGRAYLADEGGWGHFPESLQNCGSVRLSPRIQECFSFVDALRWGPREVVHGA